MPGSVSDSYDPEFGAGANAALVSECVQRVRDTISEKIGDDVLQNIVNICAGEEGKTRCKMNLSERELRIIRFCMNRALESL